MIRRCLLLAALSSVVSSKALAVSIDKDATNDTFVTQNDSLGGSNSTHSGDSALWAGGVPSDTPPYTVSNPLVAFNLKAYRGATVTGSAHFQLWLDGGAAGGNDTSRDLGVYASLANWNPFDNDFGVKWDNYGGYVGVQYGVNTGPLLSTVTGVTWPGTGERYITWDLPASLVQSWIDNPSSNHGVLVRNLTETANDDLRFSSKEGSVAPHLMFDVANRAGDFDNNGALDASDIDLLLKQPSSSVPPGDPAFDLNNDGKIVSTPGAAGSDADVWVHDLFHTNYGDATLDGTVNFNDLVVVAMNWGNTNKGWSAGNFNNDNVVDFADLVPLAQHYNQTYSPTASELIALGGADFAADWQLAQSLVPEPTAALGLASGVLLVRRRARRVVLS